MRRGFAVCGATALFLGSSLASASPSAEPVGPEAEPPADPAPQPAPAKRVLATGAAIVPGFIAHGAGHYVLGHRSTAGSLLLAEGVGVGMVLGGGAGLFLTGASKYTVAPLAGLAIFGVGLFSVSLLADMYGVVTTDQEAAASRIGLGPGWFESELGYRYVYTPNFSFRDFTQQSLSVWVSHTRFEPSALVSLGGDNARYRVELAQRLIGPGAGATAPREDHLDVEIAGTHHRYQPERFTRTTAELSVRGRWDLAHVGPSLRGAFVEGNLGYAYNVTGFDFAGVDIENDRDDLLLAGMGFGILLRGLTAPGSEVVVFYDHRHDDIPAGLSMGGLGSGVAGHFGLRARVFVDQRWGIVAEGMAGSAIVTGASLVFREGAPH